MTLEEATAAVTGPAVAEPLLDAGMVRALEHLSLVSLDAIVAGFAGQREGAAGAPGLEFSDYRPYAPGDDLRSIDWNVYARLRELLIKVSPSEGHIAVDLLIDASRSMDYGDPNKLRYARTLAAAFGTVALLRSDSARAWALSDGEAHAGDAMDAPRLLIPLAAEVERLPGGARHRPAVERPRVSPGRTGERPGDPRHRRDHAGRSRCTRRCASSTTRRGRSRSCT